MGNDVANLLGNHGIKAADLFSQPGFVDGSDLIYGNFSRLLLDGGLNTARPTGVQPGDKRTNDYGRQKPVHRIIADDDGRTSLGNFTTWTGSRLTQKTP